MSEAELRVALYDVRRLPSCARSCSDAGTPGLSVAVTHECSRATLCPTTLHFMILKNSLSSKSCKSIELWSPTPVLWSPHMTIMAAINGPRTCGRMSPLIRAPALELLWCSLLDIGWLCHDMRIFFMTQASAC